MKATLKWERAKPIYKPDNIVSSKARETGDRGFIPKYEQEKLVKMGFIMSNEYMRLWFAERDFHIKDALIREQIKAEEKSMYRRQIQRLMPLTTKQKEKYLPPIQMKRFQNIPSRVDHGIIVKAGDKPWCSKYLKSLEEGENLRYKPDCPKPKKKNTKKQEGSKTLLEKNEEKGAQNDDDDTKDI